MIDIRTAISQAAYSLQASSTTARLDTEVLLAYVLKKSRNFLYSHSETNLTSKQKKTFQQLVQKRSLGWPIAYLTGTKEFWSLPLKLTEQTLIPRPETEKLVECTLELLKNQSQAKILDLGTGSGAIALALATERPDWKISACDNRQETLLIAKENAASLGLDSICFYQSHWFDTLPRDFYHAIVSNPPYIAKNDPHLNEGDLRFEPVEALVSGEEGLDDLKIIIENSYNFLLPGGYLLVEHGYNQKLAITSILKQSRYSNVRCWKDDTGNERVCSGQKL